METLTIVYWYRFGLGIVAALICVAGLTLTNTIFTSVIQGVSLSLIFYIITYYVIKMKFVNKVEKPTKLVTQGIGVYFLAWIVSWTLMLSLVLSPTIPVAIFDSPSQSTLGPAVTFNATADYAFQGRHVTAYSWIFGDNSPAGSNQIVNHTYAKPGNYTVLLYVGDNYGLVDSPCAHTLEIKNITG